MTNGDLAAQSLPTPARAGRAPVVFMWVGANRLLDEAPEVLEDMLRFAGRHGIIPYSSGMADPDRLDRFLSLCRSLGIERTWIEIGVPRELTGDATVAGFVSDPSRRERVLELYRELGTIYRRHYPDFARVTLFDEAPLGPFRAPLPDGGRSYLREMELFRTHGPAAFAHLQRAFKEAMPEAEVGLFLHHPHNAPPATGGEYSFLGEFVERAAARDARPDFIFSDVYRGYINRGYGFESTNAYITSVAAETRRVAERYGIAAYQLGQAHTIKLGYTPSRWEIDGNVDAMLAGGADGIGWYWPNYAATDRLAPEEPTEVDVSFDPFVPNAWGAIGPAGSMYATSRDRWVYAYLRALEATGRLEPAARFDLWLYGHDFDHAEHQVALRGNDGVWHLLGNVNGQHDIDAYEPGAAPEHVHSYDGRWHAVVFRGLDRERFLLRAPDGRRMVELRMDGGDGDGSDLAAVYAMPYRPTRNFLTEAETTRLIEGHPRRTAVEALAHHVRPHTVALSPGETVEVVLRGEATSPGLEYPDATGGPATGRSLDAPATESHPHRHAGPPTASFWRRQGLDILNAWTEHGQDGHGAYHAVMDRAWTPAGDDSRYPGMVARHLFAHAVGYMLGGADAELERARQILAWLMEHGWDGEHGGWYDEVEVDGRVVRDSKDLFMQVYAVTGLAMYYFATRDHAVLETIRRSIEILDRRAWDAKRGGYYRALNRDLSIADRRKDVSPQLAPVSGYLLYLYLATRDPAYLTSAERITRVVLERMRDDTGWLLEHFDEDWRPQPGRRGFTVNVGHNVELAWSGLRLAMLGVDGLEPTALELGRRIRQAGFLDGPGLWAKSFPLDGPDSLDVASPWWIQAYGNMFSLFVHRVTGAARPVADFAAGADTWNRSFVDHRHGAVVLSVDSAGTVVRGDKAVRTKTSYHSLEHALLCTLYTGLWLTGEPVALHFRIRHTVAGQRLYAVPVEDPAARIRSVWIDGERHDDFSADSGYVTLPAGDDVRLRVVLEGPATPAGWPGAMSAGDGAAAPRFDLVVHGQRLGEEGIRVLLRENPLAGDAWVDVATLADCTAAGAGPTATLFCPGLESARFLGRDIRERYLALRVVARRDGASLRAAYVLPAALTGRPSAVRAAELDARIRSAPEGVAEAAVAVVVYPRPRPVPAAGALTEHVELPVRHRAPGVVEVEWLEILFRSRR